MGTRIKGHRIEEEAIEKKHIKNDVKFTENEDLTLNYPTHDNSNDLTFEQNQILTQGGNADSLHYHSGGAGGEAGILTRKEIDKTLMNLMLRLNSVETGLDNVILDQLDDIKDLDHGYNAPFISNIETVDGTLLEESLLENQTYGYRLLTKINGSQTNTSNDFYINVDENHDYPNTLLTLELPVDNEGYQLFRKNANYKEYIVSFNDLLNLESPEEVEYDIIPSEYMTKSDFLRIKAKESNIRTINSSENLFENSSNEPLNFGEFDVGENYAGDNEYIALKSNSKINKIDEIVITFNTNELDIARDFKIQYTNESNPNLYDDFTWKDFTNLKNNSESAIDFEVVGSSVINNEEYTVTLGFDTLRNITGIRLQVLYKAEACYVTDIHATNLLARLENEIGTINKELITSFNVKDINSLEFKLRAEYNEWPYIDMYFKDEDEVYYPNSVTDLNNETNSWNYNIGNKIIRTTLDNVRAYTNIQEEDRFVIKFRNGNPGTNITIKDLNIVVGNTADDGKDIINKNYQTFTELTFNGETEITTDEEYIYSDPFKFNNFPVGGFDDIYHPIISFEIVGDGNLYFHSDSYNYTFWADPLITDTKDPGNTGNFNSLYSNAAACTMQIFNGRKYYRLEHTSFDKNTIDFRKTLMENILNSNEITDFEVKELEFNIHNSKADNTIDISDIHFHDKKEIFSSSFMKEYIEVHNQEYLLNNWSTSYYGSGDYATNYDPIISTYLLSEPYLVDNLRLELYSSQSYTPKDFIIQVTSSSSATLGDPLSSDLWENIQDPHIISKIIEQNLFKGNLDTENGFTNNNLFDLELDVGFNPVEIQGIRFVFYEAYEVSHEIRIQNVYLYEATNSNDVYELIKDVSVNQPETIQVRDNNLQSLGTFTLKDLPINETGTRNIWFNSNKKLLEKIDESQPGIIYTNIISTNGVYNFLMNVQSVTLDEVNDTVETYISNDGGETYTEVLDFEIINTMPSIGGDIKFKFILNGDAKLNAYSLLYSL